AISDVDSLNLAGATVKVYGGTFTGDGDVLAASTVGTNITASYNTSNETLTLSGMDTLAHYQNVLDTVSFASTSSNPTNSESKPSRQITWVLNDGGAPNNLSTAVTTTVNITPVPATVPASNKAVVGGPGVASNLLSLDSDNDGGTLTISGISNILS